MRASIPHLPEGAVHFSEQDPLISHSSEDNSDGGAEAQASDVEKRPAGGTILGIHNLAIVMPQFIVSLILFHTAPVFTLSKIAVVASVIFRIVDESGPDATPSPGADLGHNTYLGKNGVAWVLRFGGLCTLIGAAVCRKVPPTKTEKQMRSGLAVLKELKVGEEP